MRRDVLRFSGWVGVVLLLTLVLISGCTRSKSAAPPATPAEGTAEAAPTQPAGDELTPSPLSGDEALEATTTAWAVETATAQAQTPQTTEVSETVTPEPTASDEPTAPAATEPPAATEAPGPTEPPAATEPPPSTEATTYKVQAGENLFRIALKYGLTYQALAAHNGIANPNIIYVGQELKIPASGAAVPTPSPGEGRYHTVQLGENLFRIALKYNMVFTRLAAANNLSYPYTIYPNQKLIIP